MYTFPMDVADSYKSVKNVAASKVGLINK